MSPFSRTTLIIITTCLLAATAGTLPAQEAGVAFRYRDYVPKTDIIYAETARLRQLAGDLRSFYMGLRPDTGQNEIVMLSAGMKETAGFSIFDDRSMAEAGVSTDGPIAFSMARIPQPQGEQGSRPKQTKITKVPGPDWSLFLPASSSQKLYRHLQKAFSRTAPGADATRGGAIEIEAGKLLHVPGQGLFISRGETFLVLSNAKSRALAGIVKSKNPISRAAFFTGFAAHMKKEYGAIPQTLAYCVNFREFTESMAAGGAKGGGISPELSKEIADNLISEGGVIRAGEHGIVMKSDSLYRPGYLNDTGKTVPRLFQSTRQPLLSDGFAATPVMFLRARLDVGGLIGLLRNIIPNFNLQYSIAMAQITQKTGVNPESAVLNNMNGNFSLIIDRFPEGPGRDVSFAISAGYRPESADTIKGFMSALGAAAANTVTGAPPLRETHSLGDLWTITSVKKSPRTAQVPDGEQQSQPVLERHYLLFSSGEMTYSPDRALIDTLSQGRANDPLVKRLPGLESANPSTAHLMFFLDIGALSAQLLRTPAGIFMAPAAPYLERITSLTVTSTRLENRITAETRLNVRASRQKAQ